MPSRVRVLATALLLAACSGGQARLGAASGASIAGYQTTGLASWYGEELAGSRTASGTRFDPQAITAAHRTLPLGSFAEVTSLDTGQSIIVLINDRGPGRKDRIIDLSRGAAQQLGFAGRSVANVRIRAVTPSLEDAIALRSGRPAALRPVKPDFVRASSTHPLAPSHTATGLDPSRRYVLQVASFTNERRARALADVLHADVVSSGSLWRVRTGAMKTVDLQRTRDALAARGYGDAQILPVD